MAEDGANAAEIMALLGHASLNTSQAYIDAIAKEQRKSAAANRTYATLLELAGHDAPDDDGSAAALP